jgi:hypothetical protein
MGQTEESHGLLFFSSPILYKLQAFAICEWAYD